MIAAALALIASPVFAADPGIAFFMNRMLLRTPGFLQALDKPSLRDQSPSAFLPVSAAS